MNNTSLVWITVCRPVRRGWVLLQNLQVRFPSIIIEWLGLEGTLKPTRFQPPAMGWLPPIRSGCQIRAPSNLALSTSRDGASTASLGSSVSAFLFLFCEGNHQDSIKNRIWHLLRKQSVIQPIVSSSAPDRGQPTAALWEGDSAWSLRPLLIARRHSQNQPSSWLGHSEVGLLQLHTKSLLIHGIPTL